MDKNHLAAAGFYYTKWSDVVRCAFCGVELGYWEEGDDPFKDHQRCSPSCGFIKGLFVGNIPIGSGNLPETSPQSLPEAATCAGLNAVSVLVCIYSFVMFVFYNPALILNVISQLHVREFLNTC